MLNFNLSITLLVNMVCNDNTRVSIYFSLCKLQLNIVQLKKYCVWKF